MRAPFDVSPASLRRRKTSKKKPAVLKEFRFGFPNTPYGALRKTRESRKSEIRQLQQYLAGFFSLVFHTPAYVFIQLTKQGFFAGKEEVEKNRMLLFMKYNEVMTPTIFSCINEFLVFLSELQTAAYSVLRGP